MPKFKKFKCDILSIFKQCVVWKSICSLGIFAMLQKLLKGWRPRRFPIRSSARFLIAFNFLVVISGLKHTKRRFAPLAKWTCIHLSFLLPYRHLHQSWSILLAPSTKATTNAVFYAQNGWIMHSFPKSLTDLWWWSYSQMKCSITYRMTRFFLPLRETIEKSAKRRHLWHYWAKRGAARRPECNADSSIGSRGCKQIGLQGRVWGRYRILFTNPNNYKTLW